MLLTPPHFENAHDVALSDNAIAHVFIVDALIQSADQPGPLPWRFYRDMGLTPANVHGLGRINGEDHVAVALHPEQSESSLPDGYRAGGLRSWFGVLDDDTLAISMRAVQVLAWDRTHQFCGACGSPTTLGNHERVRSCSTCKLTVYPRISPAMMVLVTRGNELLLGRGVNFPSGFYSALAGFVEAGESVEETVHREVMEEVNVKVKNLRYFNSQSWPFPNSLMIAFTAEYDEGDLKPDTTELIDAKWFDVNDLPRIPPKFSIARALIDATVDRISQGQ